MGFGHRNPDRILGGRDFSLINPGRRGLGVLTLRVCVWWWWWGGEDVDYKSHAIQ